MKLASLLPALLLLGGVTLPATPAAAQNQRIIEVFGDDPCPTSNGEEIVVCNRRPDADRYRIPETLRRAEEPRGVTSSGVALAESTASASRASSGMDNCSPVGAAGHTGCFRRQANEQKAARKQAAKEVPVVGE